MNHLSRNFLANLFTFSNVFSCTSCLNQLLVRKACVRFEFFFFHFVLRTLEKNVNFKQLLQLFYNFAIKTSFMERLRCYLLLSISDFLPELTSTSTAFLLNWDWWKLIKRKFQYFWTKSPFSDPLCGPFEALSSSIVSPFLSRTTFPSTFSIFVPSSTVPFRVELLLITIIFFKLDVEFFISTILIPFPVSCFCESAWRVAKKTEVK